MGGCVNLCDTKLNFKKYKFSTKAKNKQTTSFSINTAAQTFSILRWLNIPRAKIFALRKDFLRRISLMKTFREDLHLRICCTEIFRKDSFFRLSYIKQGLIFVNQEKWRIFIELNILHLITSSHVSEMLVYWQRSKVNADSTIWEQIW